MQLRLLASSVIIIFLVPIARADYQSACTKGVVGDINNSYLTSDGLTIDPMNNDFIGGTDKYMTGAMTLGLLKSTRPLSGNSGSTKGSFELIGSWHAITPTTTSSVGGKALGGVSGRYADWMEVEGTYAETYENSLGRWKGQFSLGAGHIGSKGMKYVHRGIHQAIGMSTTGTDYTDQPAGLTNSYDIFLAYIFGEWNHGALIGVGAESDKSMENMYIKFNYLIRFSADISASADVLVARQIRSEIYTAVLPYRFESGLAVSLWRYYQPGVRYVSTYLKSDPVGQIYADLIRISVPM
jgi:hypothetical protein